MKPIKERIKQRVINARILSGVHREVMHLHYKDGVTNLGLDAFYKVMSNKFEDAINEIH